MRQIAAITLVVSALLVVPGWHFGYHSPWPYVWFWLLNTLAFTSAWLLAERFSPSAFQSTVPSVRLDDACIRVAIIGFALIAACGMGLGIAGLLNPAAYGVCLSLLLTVLLLTRPGSSPRPSTTIAMPWLHPVAILLPPIAILIVCVGLTHPPVEYDSLMYHLLFPARWLQDHRLSIIPTPFGSDGPAYEPGNGELWFLWLMLPFHGDLLARVGQFPFYGLAGLTLYALARKTEAAPAYALYAGGLFLLARPVVEQAVGANVDILFASTFLIAVYFGLTAAETGQRADVALWGISVGLCLGTKYVGLIYSPLLLAFALGRRVRREAIWAVPGIALLAAPWYLRNWAIGGSPVYPASLAFAGLTVARGAYAPTVLRASSWEHMTDPAVLPGIVRQAFGPDLVVAWSPFAALGLWMLLRRRQWMVLAITLALSALMVALFWFVNPYNNVYSARYLFAAVGLAMLLVPSAFRVLPRLDLVIHLGLGAAIVWLLTLSSRPFVAGRSLWLYAAIAGLTALFWRRGPWRLGAVIASYAAASAMVFTYAVRTCSGDCTLLQLSPFTRPTLFAGWEWIEQHVTGSTIAYAGTNIPYRLLGPQFENHVYYVNIDRHQDWRYHDYERAARRHSDYKPPDKPNPRFDRQQGYEDAWIGNLERLDVRYLFVARISLLVRDDFWHDEEGFPVEETWAERHPELFERLYDNPEVRIYSLRR